jgi:hypothetical protein
MNFKSQSSIEFMVLAGMAFFAVIIFVGVSIDEIKEFKDRKEFLTIKDLALKLQKEVSIAAYVEDGYDRTFTLPNELQGPVDYTIQMTDKNIVVSSSKSVFTVAIPTVTGTFVKGANTIQKTNGQILINN